MLINVIPFFSKDFTHFASTPENESNNWRKFVHFFQLWFNRKSTRFHSGMEAYLELNICNYAQSEESDRMKNFLFDSRILKLIVVSINNKSKYMLFSCPIFLWFKYWFWNFNRIIVKVNVLPNCLISMTLISSLFIFDNSRYYSSKKTF